MSKEKNEKLNELRIENEINKMKLIMEHGAQFVEVSGKKLPPEVERIWLERIMEFEKAYANAKRIKIHDYLKNPILTPEKEISDSEMAAELRKLQNLFLQKDIVIESLAEVDDREMYRFISEELVFCEIDDIRIKGMVTNFIYEEFKPNQEINIKSCAETFIRSILNKEIEPKIYDIADKIDTQNGVLSKNEVIKFLALFRESYCTFEIIEFNITNLKNIEDYAKIVFELKYIATFEGSNESKHFEGVGGLEFNFDGEHWLISTFHFPGLTL
jgi:hypothetical protein